jgi:hypothetical protein
MVLNDAFGDGAGLGLGAVGSKMCSLAAVAERDRQQQGFYAVSNQDASIPAHLIYVFVMVGVVVLLSVVLGYYYRKKPQPKSQPQ